MLKTNKFMKAYLQIIKESSGSIEPTNNLYKTVKSEHIEKINSFKVNFVEFENGKWNYQLNQKYSVDCEDPNDPAWDVWVPDFDAMDPDSFFDSLEDAKAEASIDIDNQLGWGEIVKPEETVTEQTEEDGEKKTFIVHGMFKNSDMTRHQAEEIVAKDPEEAKELFLEKFKDATVLEVNEKK